MMQKHVGIQKVVSVLLLVALLLTFATPAFAEGGPTPNKTAPFPELPKPIHSTVAYQRMQKAITLLQPYIEISSDGIPSLTIGLDTAEALGVQPSAYLAIQAEMLKLSDTIQQLPEDRRPIVKDGQWILPDSSSGVRAQSICVTIPKWALQAFAWYKVIQGGAMVAVGGFVEATIIGLPAGAVLNALGVGWGLTGTGLLWWVDNFYSAEGRVVCIW